MIMLGSLFAATFMLELLNGVRCAHAISLPLKRRLLGLCLLQEGIGIYASTQSSCLDACTATQTACNSQLASLHLLIRNLLGHSVKRITVRSKFVNMVVMKIDLEMADCSRSALGGKRCLNRRSRSSNHKLCWKGQTCPVNMCSILPSSQES